MLKIKRIFLRIGLFQIESRASRQSGVWFCSDISSTLFIYTYFCPLYQKTMKITIFYL